MAKRAKKKQAQSTPESNSKDPVSPTIASVLRVTEESFLFNKKSRIGDVISVIAMYIVTLILFWSFMGDNIRFNLTGDSVAARAWNDVGAEIDDQVDGPPAWNPYVFVGYPTYGSLAFHPKSILNPANWLDVPGKFLFGMNELNVQIFYYFLSGLLMYLFARGVGLPWWASLLAGITFLLNPYNISLAEAAHGSKHWTISMMPLVLLMTHWVLTKRRLLDLSLLALATAAMLLSLHAQIAYYALLAGGGYALIWFVREVIRDRSKALRGMGGYAGGTALGLAISAFVYWPVYVFSKYSVRGAGPLRTEGDVAGLDWKSATDWSLHPLESLQFLNPGWFGLGGNMPPDRMLTPETAINYNLYWGWMPMTQSSLYMGIIPLLLAVLAAVWLWKRNGIVRWMSIAAVLAWVVSFGKYLPVLYGPMYYVLPFFNKFRVPSMALVVTALGVSLLAAYGLAELVKRILASREDEQQRKKLSLTFSVILSVAIVGFAIAAFYSGPMDTFLRAGEAQQYDAQTLQMLLELRWEIFTLTLLATSFILAIFALAVRFALKPRWAFLLPTAIAVAVIFTGHDLLTIDKRFLHSAADRAMQNQLAAGSAVRFLQQQRDTQPEPFRVFPIAGDFQNNVWMYHRIQTIGGYSPNKLRVYQDLLDYAFFDNEGLPNLSLSGMMNARYLIARQELPPSFSLAHADETTRTWVYDNPFAMPRAWFVDEIEIADSPDAAMTAIADPEFDPHEVAILLAEPEFMPTPHDTTRGVIVPREDFSPHGFSVELTNEQPGFIVLSEIWYPQGWIAELNGEPVEFVQANYVLRGLPVPAGNHTLTVKYDPPEIAAGFAVTRVAILITLALLGFSIFQIVRPRKRLSEDTDG
jgi:hypothetical protein